MNMAKKQEQRRVSQEEIESDVPMGTTCTSLYRPALSGGMDWWRMEWLFSRLRKIFFRG